MKTKTDKRKLMLNREVLLQLEPAILDRVAGGAGIVQTDNTCRSVMGPCTLKTSDGW